MSNNENGKIVKLALAFSGVVLACAGAVFIMNRKSTPKMDADDCDFFAEPPAETQTLEVAPPKEVKPVATKVKAVPTETITQSKTDNKASDICLDEVLKELDSSSKFTIIPETLVSNVKNVVDTTEDEYKSFPHLGLRVKNMDGWEIREELSPSPNVSLITITKPEFMEQLNPQNMSQFPVVTLSVEDIRTENLNLTEFKERTKALAMDQMLMMSGGAVQPLVTKDTAVKEGPYRYMMEYVQSLPPFMDLCFLNLLEVRNGIAYTFQILCSPKVLNEYRSTFLSMARSMEIQKLDLAVGYIKVCTGKVEVHVDSSWGWQYPAEGNCLAKFTLLSTVKSEEYSLYYLSDLPETQYKVRSEKVVDGVKVVSAMDGIQEQKLFIYGNFALVANPVQKPILYAPEEVAIHAIRSVSESSEEPKPYTGATFICDEYGFSFDIIGGSRVLATRIGRGTIVYGPKGKAEEENPEESGPTVTIRVGTPKEDPECASSLEGWEELVRSSPEGAPTQIKYTTINDKKCLTFLTKEMQEVGFGKKAEYMGKAYVFVENEKTTLIRWETLTENWKRYERNLFSFIESFKLTPN